MTPSHFSLETYVRYVEDNLSLLQNYEVVANHIAKCDNAIAVAQLALHYTADFRELRHKFRKKLSASLKKNDTSTVNFLVQTIATCANESIIQLAKHGMLSEEYQREKSFSQWKLDELYFRAEKITTSSPLSFVDIIRSYRINEDITICSTTYYLSANIQRVTHDLQTMLESTIERQGVRNTTHPYDFNKYLTIK